MKALRRSLALVAVLALLTPAFVYGQPIQAGGSPVSSIQVAPCENPLFIKQAAVTASSSTTVTVIALSAGHATYVCAGFFQGAGGAATFEYGTGTNCGTGTTTITGALSTTASLTLNANGVPYWVIPAGNAVCLLGAASAAGTGFLTYAQP